MCDQNSSLQCWIPEVGPDQSNSLQHLRVVRPVLLREIVPVSARCGVIISSRQGEDGEGKFWRAGPGVVEEPAGYVLDGTRGAAMRYTVVDWYQK